MTGTATAAVAIETQFALRFDFITWENPSGNEPEYMLPSPPTAKSSNSLRVISFDELVPPGKFRFNPKKVVKGTLNAPLLIALAIIRL